MLEKMQTGIAFIEGIGGLELLMVAFIALLLFGGEKLPSFARTLGKSMRELKKATSEVEREIKKAIEEAPEDVPAKPKLPPSVPVEKNGEAQTVDKGSLGGLKP